MHTAAPRTMILIDPDLDPDPNAAGADAFSRSSRKAPPKPEKVPSAHTLARFLAAGQAAVGLRGQVTVLLTTDATLGDLNRRFLGKNKPTDVLSFPATLLPVANPAERVVGDLAISVPTARRQAAEQAHSLAVELKVLILHGLLHLAGHDHETDSGQMHLRERTLRSRLGLPQGLIERGTSPKVRPTAGGRARLGLLQGLTERGTSPKVRPTAGGPSLSPAFGRKGGKARTSARRRVSKP